MSDTLTTLATDAPGTTVETTVVTDTTDTIDINHTTDEVLAEDQLGEEVSIDGMCGVY